MSHEDQSRQSARPQGGQGRRHRSATGRPRATSYPRFLGLSVVGALIPGLGLIAAGRRRIGAVVLSGFLLGVAAVVTYMARSGRNGLARLGADSERINVIGFGLIGVAAIWLLLAVISFFLLEPRGLGAGRRLFAVFLMIVVASAVITPMGIGSRYAFTQRDFIESVFPDDREQHSLTIPEESTDEDPWAGRGRVNLLILGSDAGEGREGVRTDTIMVASVNTQTGDTALFSLPRNLQYTPFPEGTPMRDTYPSGFHGAPDSAYWLSSIYRNVPPQFPDYFEGIDDPGAEALKLAVGEALALEIDYYVMVNLDGFEAIVDALGGVRIDVPYRVPMGTQTIEGVGCTPARDWIEPGERVLSGGEALWFARARCGPPPINDDYERMRRQRCLVGAIAEQADPFTLLTRYLQLESAVRDNISTDIGRSRLQDFAELALRVQEAEITSLPFTDEIVTYGSPDYELIRQFVRNSLDSADNDSVITSPEEAHPGQTGDPAVQESGPDIGEHDQQIDPQPQDLHESGEETSGGDGAGDTGEFSEPGEDSDETDESTGAQSIDEVC